MSLFWLSNLSELVIFVITAQPLLQAAAQCAGGECYQARSGPGGAGQSLGSPDPGSRLLPPQRSQHRDKDHLFGGYFILSCNCTYVPMSHMASHITHSLVIHYAASYQMAQVQAALHALVSLASVASLSCDEEEEGIANSQRGAVQKLNSVYFLFRDG